MLNRPGCWIALLSAMTVLSLAAPLAAQSTPAAKPVPPEASSDSNNGANNAVLPNGAPLQPKQISVQPPFVLAPQQQAELDHLLTDWENNSNAIKTYKCTFTRLEYDPAFIANPNQPKTECHGELKYAAPDKGLFHVTIAFEFVADPATKSYKKTAVEPTEYWTCNGKSMFQVDAKKKQIIEQPIPPEMQGKSITEGPLPFVFGAKADVLKKRYFMRIITPEERSKDEVWLEALPRTQKDAANFSRVELILSKPEMQPVAIQIYNPGAGPENQSRTVIKLESPSVNSPWAPIQELFNDFARPNLIGYKHVVEQPQVPPPSSPQIPAGSAADQASRARSPQR